jgi:hypothetical protein
MKAFIQLPGHKFQDPAFHKELLHRSCIVVLQDFWPKSRFGRASLASPMQFIPLFMTNIDGGRRAR